MTDDRYPEHICSDGSPDWGPSEGCPNCGPKRYTLAGLFALRDARGNYHYRQSGVVGQFEIR